MKTQLFKTSLWIAAVCGALALATGTATAQDSSSATAGATPAVSPAPVQLPYGTAQIVQLSQAKISDATIISYIQNSGNSYGLTAGQIIYLRQQGVSDAVVNAMLNQPKTYASAQAAPQQTTAETSTAVAQPTVTYVQSAPPSTVYVIPDTQTYNYDAWYYGYPYPYYGYYYPPVSVSLGFGWGWGGGWRGGYGGWHGGYHGGFHGGWHH